MNPQIQEPQRVPSRICKNKCMPEHTVMKMQNTREKEQDPKGLYIEKTDRLPLKNDI